MTQTIIKADQMREIASRNPTAHGLLLYLALYNLNSTEDFSLSSLKGELSERGVEVNEQQLYDTLQELEDLGLGSVVYAKKGEGDDVFKRGYNLNVYARRAFPVEYLNEWTLKANQVDGDKVKLFDPNFRFQKTQEEREQEKSSGNRGRPKGYSHKLGRFFTPEELAAREAMKTHPRSRGRPVGWRKYPGQDNTLRANSGRMNKQTNGSGKRGRPAGYSPKLGRFLNARELQAKMFKKPGKRGRPVGWRKDPAKVARKVAKRQGRPVTDTKTKAFIASLPREKFNLEMRVLNIPLKDNRNIRIELPKSLNSDEVALLKLNLDAII